jgi:MinD-like ATPase involved in chromosome partitioning or flagellar assembly
MRADGGIAAAPAIVVAGSMLGVGASTVAGLVALSAARAGRPTLLVDPDPASPLEQWLGVSARRGVSITDSAAGDGTMIRVHDALHLLRVRSGDAGARAPARFGSRFELVVMDAGWRADALLQACAGGAERVLVVVTPGHAPVSAGYALVKVVERRFPGTRFEVAINRHGPDCTVALFEHLQAAALTFLHRALALAALIPDDACLRAGTAGGMTLEDAAAGSAVAAAVDSMTFRNLAELDHAREPWPAPPLLLRGV